MWYRVFESFKIRTFFIGASLQTSALNIAFDVCDDVVSISSKFLAQDASVKYVYKAPEKTTRNTEFM